MNHRSRVMSFKTFRAFAFLASAAAAYLASLGAMSGCGGEDPSGNLIPTPDASVDGGGNDASSGDGDADDKQCTRLSTKLTKARAAARACEPGESNQCGVQVTDECCPIFVTDRDSDEVKNFEAALKEYMDAGCHGFCTSQICKPDATHSCLETSNGNGVCTM